MGLDLRYVGARLYCRQESKHVATWPVPWSITFRLHRHAGEH